MPVVDKERERYKEEERKAIQRIGTGPHSAIGWLLRFLQTNLKDLSEGQWSDLGAEISAFARGKVTFFPTNVGPSRHMWRTGKEIKGSGLIEKKRFKEELFPPKKTIQELHSTLDEAIDNYSMAEAYFPSIELRLSVPNPQKLATVLTPSESKKRSLLHLEAEKLEDTFYYYAATLLAEYGPRIKPCAVCETLFPAVREDQFFCSSKCLNRATQQRFRQRKKISET